MKKSLSLLGLAIGLATASFTANAADYVIDTKGAHASINFDTSHLGYSFITGRFNDFSGEFSFDEDNIPDSKVNVTINTNSIDTNHAERDKHIRSADFLDTSKYGEATFTSTEVVENEDGTFNITGDLTLHGETKSVTIVTEFIGEGKDPWGGERAGFRGTTRINFEDFDIKTMGPTTYADLTINVEGVKQK